MKKKHILRGLAAAVILISLQAAVLSANKTLFIKGTGINSLGTTISVATDHIIFTNGSSPLTLYLPGTVTSITDFSIGAPLTTVGSVYTAGSPAGRNVQINCAVGDGLGATIWVGPVNTLNSYYGSTGLSMSQANFDDSALTWNWTGLAANTKAAAPYKPSIRTFKETTTYYTDGTPTVATLVVASAPGSGTAPEVRELSSYAWKMWAPASPADPAADEPSATVPSATGSELSVPSTSLTAGRTYAFKVGANNRWGGPTWSNIYTHVVAGGGGGGGGGTAVSYTFNLKAFDASKLVVNSISIPPNLKDGSGVAITTASQLITYIDSLPGVGSGTVIVLGRWNSTTGKAERQTPANEGINFTLTPGEGYQVYVTHDCSITLQGTP